MADKKLTRDELNALKGRLKAPKRAATMGKRYAKQQETAEAAYQEKLAKDLKNIL
jgi:hypothetical protein